jgi:hypothetical protein
MLPQYFVATFFFDARARFGIKIAFNNYEIFHGSGIIEILFYALQG